MEVISQIHKTAKPLPHGNIFKRFLSVLILFLLCTLLLYFADSADGSGREIPVDVPFFLNGEGLKEYTLTLISPGKQGTDYELKLCDREGAVLQQFSCGPLTEPVLFSFDGLKYGYHTGLELFSAESQTGLFFTWDYEDLFSEEGIEIPRYEEVRHPWFVGAEENGDLLVKTIYLINEIKKSTDRLRRFSLDRSDGSLQIWDYPENKPIFEGNVALDGDGNPINNDYYDYLFWDDVPLLLDSSPATAISTWVMHRESAPSEESEAAGESPFERIQGQLFGNVGETTEYESRQALLEDFGFENEEPIYEYFDRFGNLLLELYLNEEAQKGCGITYQYRFTGNLEKIAILQGFTIDGFIEQEANAPDPYTLKSVYGTAGADITDYTESFEYAENGKPAHYSSEGSIDWLGDADDYHKEKILTLDFIYRDDGSLFCRKYWHNGYVFGTTYTSQSSYYDERERLIYEDAYITHGSLEYYYIYEEDKTRPAYCLFLDYNYGYAIPALVWYVG